MARIANYNRPKDTGRTLKQMFGYLVREKDPGCRRSYLICLTGDGAAEARRVRKVLEMVDDVIWNGLDQDEMEAFCGTMEKICRNLEECDFKFDEQEM